MVGRASGQSPAGHMFTGIFSPLIRELELHTSSNASKYAVSLVGSAAVSQASTALGPPWKASSFGMSMAGWRERYQRSLDVAAFWEPITMNDGRQAPR